MIWYNGNVIVSSFDKHDLAKSIKSLKKKLDELGIDQSTTRLFTTYFVEEYLKLTVQEQSNSTHRGDEEQTADNIHEEIKKLKDDNLDISFERWIIELLQRRNKIRHVAERNFPNSWPGIEFTLSVQKILNISECTLPFAGIILSRAGGNKTLSTEIVLSWPTVYYTRNFTAKAFVSHNTAVSKDNLPEIDMLPKIRFKLLLTPELTPLFSASEDDIMENLGIITSVLDGKGYISHSGAHGRRGYHGNYMFVWVGAAVDIPYRVQKLLATLGPKLYFFRLPYVEKTDQELLDNLNGNFEKKRKELEDAVIEYLRWFEICPVLIKDNEEESHLMKIKWNSDKDDLQAKEKIKELGKLLAKLRGHVDIWSYKKEHEYSEYAYSFTQTEDPARAITQLYNLARGHALSMGRNYITMEDVPMTAKVVLSTASIERVSLLDLLLAREGIVTLSRAARVLSMSKSTILKTMTELAALEIVEINDITVEFNQTKQITLETEFGWLLTEEFTKLREGFIPIDNSKYIDDEKTKPPTYKERIFWQRFEEIEKQSIDGVVESQKLKDSLVASTIFFVGDAVSMIESMVERGRLEVVENGYYRRVKPTTTNKTVGLEAKAIHGGHKDKGILAKTLLVQCLYGGGEGMTILPPTCALFL